MNIKAWLSSEAIPTGEVGGWATYKSGDKMVLHIEADRHDTSARLLLNEIALRVAEYNDASTPK